MRYGKKLPEHGRIGCVAPAFGCDREPYHTAFMNAQKKWKEMGYEVVLGPNCYAGKGIGISNTPKACGEELVSWYKNSDNDCLISCGGGELMCEILDYVDFDALRQAEPKWYMGYSDNTNFTFLLATLCDTASVYGPCAPAFGMEPWHASLEDAMDIIRGMKHKVSGYPLWEKEALKNEENPLLPYNVTEPRVIRKFPDRNTEMHGRLLGGCMDCLVNILGTRYDTTREFAECYQEDGIIWFLEACDLNVYGIRRAMWQMEHAGWFEHVKGFLIGRPMCFGQEMFGLDAYNAVLEVAGRKQVPVIMDLDLGHLPPMMPIVTGSLGHVRVTGNEIEIEMEFKC